MAPSSPKFAESLKFCIYCGKVQNSNLEHFLEDRKKNNLRLSHLHQSVFCRHHVRIECEPFDGRIAQSQATGLSFDLSIQQSKELRPKSKNLSNIKQNSREILLALWVSAGAQKFDLEWMTEQTYSKVSINCPVLLNDLVWFFFKKSLLNDQVHLRKNRSYCFISGLPRPIFGLYSTTWSGYLDKVSIKRPVLYFFQILEA